MKWSPILRDRKEPIVNLDMKGINRIDASCSREALANLIEQFRGQKWFYLTNIANADAKDNIDHAFDRKAMKVIARTREEWRVLGEALPAQLVQTLEIVERLSEATARQVCAQIRDLQLPACSNRLKDLSDSGLLVRIESSAASGGKEFLYYPVK